jgi:hypothetical protein
MRENADHSGNQTGNEREGRKVVSRIPEWLFYLFFVAFFPVWFVWMEIDRARGLWPYQVEAEKK